MPVVGVNRNALFEKLGRTFTVEEFEDLCFKYGIELDDVTSERQMRSKELNQADVDVEVADEDIIYRIDIPANRYDMLCIEGIARALNIYLGNLPLVKYSISDKAGGRERMFIKPETVLVRPFITCAVLRGIKLDKARYDSFIDLQDKLHQNLCRNRSLVAMGTHDMAAIKGPFTYEALPPQDINFIPLKQQRSFNAKELMEHYEANDLKLRKYVPIIKDSLVYPVIYDSQREVLSLPPIINSARSQISLNTRDVFIEMTSVDQTKANIVMQTLCAMFSEYTTEPYRVEQVEVIDAAGNRTLTPDMSTRTLNVSADYVNETLGLSLSAEEMLNLLKKMALDGKIAENGSELVMNIPVTRSDILHRADLAEDVGIAFGYNEMKRELPPVNTIGRELPLMQLTNLLRNEIKDYVETLTWMLCSRKENFEFMCVPDTKTAAVSIGNPATAEFEVCRTSLLPALLKTVAYNKDAALPLKLFEVSDVVLIDDTTETGARNERRVAAVHVNGESEFEVIHGLVIRVMEVLGAHLQDQELAAGMSAAGAPLAAGSKPYFWRESSHPSYFPGRSAEIVYDGNVIGRFGIIHPRVLRNFEIPYPVTAMELTIEPFCYDQLGKKFDMH